MANPSIATAAELIESILAVLDDAYWEAGTIEKKDAIYALIALLQNEKAEIAKLSIQDHDLEYEPITSDFRHVRGKLNNLRKTLDEFVMRPSTAREIDRLFAKVVSLTG